MRPICLPLFVLGFAACTHPSEPAERIPEVQRAYPTLAEAIGAAPLAAFERDGVPALALPRAVVTFGDGRLHMHERENGVLPEVQADLEVTSFGRGHPGRSLHLERPAVAAATAVQADGPRVLWSRGAITEWYLNTPEGIEQGFTLAEPPGGTGDAQLVMELTGDLRARSVDDAIHLVDRDGTSRLRYSGLFVEDADGEVLPSEMSAACADDAPCTIALSFDDTNARYPVYIDPLLAQSRLVVDAADAVGGLGTSIDLQGDWAAVGSPSGTDGRVFILERNEANPDAWAVEQSLFNALDGFGARVSLDFPYLAVAAPESETVVVYEYRAGSWTELDTLTGAIAGARFGEGLHLDIPYLGVGSPEAGEGLVNVFVLTDLGFAPLNVTPSLAAGSPGDRLGATVKLRFPLIFAGAPGYASGDGAVSVFDAATGSEQAFLLGNSASGEGLGSSLDVSPENVVVGSASAESVTVYGIRRNGTSHSLVTPQQIPAPPVAGLGFGSSVALLSDTLVIGDADPSGQSKVHVFARGSSSWFHSQTLPLSTTNDGSPMSLAITSRSLAAGAGGSGPTGTASVWDRVADQLSLTANLSTSGTSSSGTSVAIAGRLALVGDPTAHPTLGGRADLFERSSGGTWAQRDVLYGDTTVIDNGFGTSVGVDGEVFVVGAPQEQNEGRVYVYRREDSATKLTNVLTPPSVGANQDFGAAVAVDGQLLAVGAPKNARGSLHVYVLDSTLAVTGSPTSVNGETDISASGAPVQFGTAVGVQGDLIVAGARGWNASGGSIEDAGAAEVYQYVAGAPSPSLSRIARLEGTRLDDRCGGAVFIDADRIAVGCDNNGAAGLAGRARVYRGDLDDYSLEVEINGASQADAFGAAVALAQDRLFVGAPTNATVYVYDRNTGGEDQWGEQTELTLASTPGTRFGAALDVDGSAIIVGSPDDGSTGTARIYELDADLPIFLTRDVAEVPEDGAVVIDLLANDWDGNGSPLTMSGFKYQNGPINGTLTVGAANVTYTPAADFNGTDTFTYSLPGTPPTSVTIQVSPVNDPPVAVPDAYDAIEETLLLGTTVLANDTDIDDTVLTASLVAPPSHAESFSLAPDGTFEYLGVLDYAGPDTFTYQAVDASGAPSATTTVSLSVADTPEQPILSDSLWSTPRDTPLVVPAPGLAAPALAELPGTGAVFSTADTTGLAGTVVVQSSGAFSFAPEPGFTGTTQFVVQADNAGSADTAIVSIEVEAIDSPPQALPDAYQVDEDFVLVVSASGGVLANDTDADADALSAVFAPPAFGQFVATAPDGSFTWQPAPDFNGLASLSYSVTAGSQTTGPVTITIDVRPMNDPPVAILDRYSFDGPGPHEVPASEGLLINDSDIDGDAIVAVLLRATREGEIEVQPDGGFVFTPRDGFEGTQTAGYVVNDGVATSGEATIELVVDNNPPSTAPEDTGGPATTGDTAGNCVDVFFPDRDGDGFGAADGQGRIGCVPPPGFATENGDCDDTRADQYPGAPEIQGDGIDQDCDGEDSDIRPAGSCSTAPSMSLLLTPLVLVGLRRRREPC